MSNAYIDKVGGNNLIAEHNSPCESLRIGNNVGQPGVAGCTPRFPHNPHRDPNTFDNGVKHGGYFWVGCDGKKRQCENDGSTDYYDDELDGETHGPSYSMESYLYHEALIKAQEENRKEYEILEINDPNLKYLRRKQNAKQDYEKRFGKGFSSDNSGDGPKGKKTKTISSKSVARSLVKEQMAQVVGKGMSKAIYATAAKTIRRAVRKGEKQKAKNPRPSKLTTLSERSYNFRSEIRGGVLYLSKETSRWLLCYLRPFDENCKSAGIPRPGSMPSYKVTGYIRGIGSDGTLGIGYSAGSPCLANDRVCLNVTSSLYASDQIAEIANNVVPEGYAGNANSPGGVACPNLPFTAAQLTATTTGSIIEGRCVGCSLTAMYNGNELYKAGMWYAYMDPDSDKLTGNAHTDVVAPSGGYNINSLSSRDGCEISPVTRTHVAKIVWVPPAANMNDYPPNNASGLRKVYPYSQGQTQVDANHGAPTGAIVMNGAVSPNQQPFYYEYVIHAEFVGPGVPQSLLSPSFSDVVGFDTCEMLINRAQRRAASDSRSDFNKCLREEMKRERVRMFKF